MLRILLLPPPPGSSILALTTFHPPDLHRWIKAGETSVLSNELLVVVDGEALNSKDGLDWVTTNLSNELLVVVDGD